MQATFASSKKNNKSVKSSINDSKFSENTKLFLNHSDFSDNNKFFVNDDNIYNNDDVRMTNYSKTPNSAPNNNNDFPSFYITNQCNYVIYVADIAYKARFLSLSYAFIA